MKYCLSGNKATTRQGAGIETSDDYDQADRGRTGGAFGVLRPVTQPSTDNPGRGALSDSHENFVVHVSQLQG